jgi:hypothetical protein
MTQVRRMQEGHTLHGKPQADRANSCPRSPATKVGSTTKLKKRSASKTKNKAVMTTRTPRITHTTIAGQAAT